MSRHDWELVLACGHRYFLDLHNGQVGVADESGKLPEDTDDGIVYLDRTRAIVLAEESWRVPLTRRGDPIQTPATWHEAVAVAHMFRMRVEADGVELPIVEALDRLKPCNYCGKSGGLHAADCDEFS